MLPVIEADGDISIDEAEVERVYSVSFEAYIPEKSKVRQIKPRITRWQRFNIMDIFELKRGDFHSLDSLKEGEHMTVSRVSNDNGVVGYFERPPKAKLYKRGAITVSTVGGDAFVQLDTFLATDNVIICEAKTKLRLTSLFFICLMLNQQKWRYSYGRQCYKEKLSKVNFDLPINQKGDLDESVMAEFVESTDYWKIIAGRFSVE